MKNNAPISRIVPFQLPIRPALPTVHGNVDYVEFSELLFRMDEILRLSGTERMFVEKSLEGYEQRAAEVKTPVNVKALLRFQKHSYQALRCTILKELLGVSYREMSRRLAECPLFRWFCGMEELAVIRVPGKSTLQDYASWLPEATLRSVIGSLLEALRNGQKALNLANAIEMETIWMDSTCVKANIHFPVDWVLLRDAVRTLMKATRLIRKHGLKGRMESPESFLTRMNRLSMQMTCNRRRTDSKKQRKKTLRSMKRLVKVVQAHAVRHRQLLDEKWEQTDWTRKQAAQVLRRIDSVLQLLPVASKQAHERMIGERAVRNEDKILSLYEPDLHVIVRGKAGAEVEFGNTLLIAEQKDGLLVDWQLYRDGAPADCRQLPESLCRMRQISTADAIKAIGADRGFDSSDNIRLLEKENIYNAICPKSPALLKQRMEEEKFATTQKRRAQTEARIGIFKNVFLGRPLRTKGFTRRELSIAWNVLAHNLWVVARLPQRKKLKKAA